MPDVWAHCPECDRWFYPGGQVGAGASEPSEDLDAAAPDLRCPVCAVRADRLRDRAGGDPADLPVATPAAG